MENNPIKKIVIIDIGNRNLDNNKLFLPAEAIKVSHTILPICYLYEQLVSRGYEVVTPDIYLSMAKEGGDAALISFLTNTRTKEIITAGAFPLILACLESPFIASRFYVGLRFTSRKFKYSFLFDGMKKMASPKTNFVSAHFPQTFKFDDFSMKNFTERRLITMISSNKSIDSWLKKTLLRFLYGSEVREVYHERLNAINYLASRQTFDLYGYGWDRIEAGENLKLNISKCYKGVVVSKRETIRNYKFAICFENSVFPGYVTEKIFDAMMAGVVPVYLGAPDINDYVASNAFINLKDYSNWDELYNYLVSMNEVEYTGYLDNIRTYLWSNKFREFTQEKFADNIIKVLSSHFVN